MNRRTFKLSVACALFVACGAFAAPAPAAAPAAAKPKTSLTPEQRAERQRQLRAEAEKRMGGFLQAPARGVTFRIVNRQKAIPVAFVREVADSISKNMRYYVDVEEGEGARKEGPSIKLVANADDPSLLVAPEDFWAVLNVSRLAGDNPSPEKLKARFTKELWRAFAMVLGAGNSNYQMCVMHPVTSLADLDALETSMPSSEAYTKIEVTARKLHLSRVRITSYKTACYEGWAPPPTNDVQKAHWEKAHSEKERGPVNGLKIAPPKAKK